MVKSFKDTRLLLCKFYRFSAGQKFCPQGPAKWNIYKSMVIIEKKWSINVNFSEDSQISQEMLSIYHLYEKKQ